MFLKISKRSKYLNEPAYFDFKDAESDSDSSFVIDLPGVPVIGAVDDATISTIEEEIRNSPPKKSRQPAMTDEPEMTPPAAKKLRLPVADEPFHGFLPSEVPQPVVIVPSDESVNLTKAFNVDFVDDGLELTSEDIAELTPETKAKKTQPVTIQLTHVPMPNKSSGVELDASSTPETETASEATPESAPTTTTKRPPPPSIIVPMSSIASTVSKVTPEPKKPLPALKPLPGPMVRESREWKPSAQFFKPLNAGNDSLKMSSTIKDEQHLILFTTYRWVYKARVFVLSMSHQPIVMKLAYRVHS
jgi:hypothetical protein